MAEEKKIAEGALVVEEGKAVCGGSRGILGPGEEIKASYFAKDGDKVLKNLEEKGFAVKYKAPKKKAK